MGVVDSYVVRCTSYWLSYVVLGELETIMYLQADRLADGESPLFCYSSSSSLSTAVGIKHDT